MLEIFKTRSIKIIKGRKYESCTWEEWDNEPEIIREIINFGDGFRPARQIEMTHSHPYTSILEMPAI